MSKKRKELLVIGAGLALIGWYVMSHKVRIATGSDYGVATQDDLTTVGLVWLLGVGCLVGGIITGIVGFMKADTGNSGATVRFCSNCGSKLDAGTCVSCGPGVKPAGEGELAEKQPRE
jgi:hypothetical protein